MDMHGWIAVASLVLAAFLLLREAVPLGFVAMGIPVVLALHRHRKSQGCIVRLR